MTDATTAQPDADKRGVNPMLSQNIEKLAATMLSQKIAKLAATSEAIVYDAHDPNAQLIAALAAEHGLVAYASSSIGPREIKACALRLAEPVPESAAAAPTLAEKVAALEAAHLAGVHSSPTERMLLQLQAAGWDLVRTGK